jgi:hypothetical protein
LFTPFVAILDHIFRATEKANFLFMGFEILKVGHFQ